MKTDKLIDLASLGLVAFIIFTLVKSFQGLADWLGGAGKSVSEFFGGIGEAVGEAGKTIQKAIGEAGETITKTTEKTAEKTVIPVVSVEPRSISGIGRPFTSVLSSKLKTKYKPKSKKPVDIRKLHKERPAITKSVPSKSFTEYVQKVKSKPSELQMPGIERIIAKLP